MLRFEDASATIRESVPAELVDAVAAVTALGDPAVLTLLLALVYWLYRRDATATVVGYAFVAFAVTLLLKNGLAMPRPPESVHRIETSGYGFPSGHAIAGVVVYGGLALEFDWLDESPKALAMGVVAVSVGLSRVALGVHYLGDVLVGFGVGAVVLAAGYGLWSERPGRAYVAAAVLAVPAIVVADAGADAVALLGYSLGGAVGLRAVEPVVPSRDAVEAATLAVAGLAFLVSMAVAESAVTSVPGGTFFHSAALVAGILALPAVFARVGVADATSPGTE
ncbi:phosphatase PAP2 family protein [Haloarchaeobius sp. HRN-SO-5]|uniref:phosphatase PAP2 family protein n=1 Tax=Haloarchaeobius sp. HRN-SO-5 TaxID=3446118 RepID=UPI003EBBC4DF